jgi:hypothetical protein
MPLTVFMCDTILNIHIAVNIYRATAYFPTNYNCKLRQSYSN